MKIYKIFLSHSWRYDNHYQRLINLLNQNPFFRFRDYSIPIEKKIHGPYSWVWSQIDEQIRQSSVFIFPSGVYATHSESIGKEIEIARKYNKPIIAVRPWGALRTSQYEKYADITVGWNSFSLIQAIRELCGW